MKVIFKKISFRNFLSYGNAESVVEFESGLNSIAGKNGYGKSVITDALSFVLFGYPYRKVKISELVNRINKKGLYVKLEFDIDSDSYLIERGLKPDVFRLLKNDKELELLSSKKLVQDEIDSILGIDYELFRQIIALSINAHKQFLTLPAGEKRTLVETIFHIDTFGLMLKDVKTKISELKSDISITQKERDIQQSSYDTLDKSLTRYKDALKNFDENKANTIKRIVTEICDYQNKVDTCTNNISIAKTFITNSSALVVDHSSEYKKLSEDVLNSKNSIKHLNTRHDLLCGDSCPICTTKLSDIERKKHQHSISEEISSHKNIIEVSNTRIKELDNIQEKSREIEQLLSQAKLSINSEEDKISHYSDSISRLKISLKNEEDAQPLFNLEEIERDMSEVSTTIKLTEDKIRKLEETRYIQIEMEKILSDDGVKSHFLNKLLPLLNDKINHYLDSFDMSVMFKFDNLLNETIMPIGSRDNVSYMSCSEGEKKRIDIAILLSFIDIIKSISTWDCNLLFIDELFDSAVDGDNLNLILNSLKEHTLQNNKLCVYLISHRTYENGGILDNVLEVKKEGNFSKVYKR